jgi:hypothetical protein
MTGLAGRFWRGTWLAGRFEVKLTPKQSYVRLDAQFDARNPYRLSAKLCAFKAVRKRLQKKAIQKRESAKARKRGNFCAVRNGGEYAHLGCEPIIVSCSPLERVLALPCIFLCAKLATRIYWLLLNQAGISQLLLSKVRDHG